MGTNSVNANDPSLYAAYAAQLKPQNGSAEKEQLEAVAKLKDMFFSSKTDPRTREQIIGTLCRELNDTSLGGLMSNKEENLAVRKAVWAALAEITAHYTDILKDTAKTKEAPEALKALNTLLGTLEETCDTSSTNDEKSSVRQITASVLQVCLPMIQDLNYQQASDLLERTIAIDPNGSAYEKAPAAEKVKLLEVYYTLYYCNLKNGNRGKALDYGKKYVSFLKNNTDINIATVPHLKDLESMQKLVKVIADPSSDASQKIIADTFKQILYSNSTAGTESIQDALSINPAEQNGMFGTVSFGQSSDGTAFGSVQTGGNYNIDDINHVKGQIQYKTTDISSNFNATVEVTQNLGQVKFQESLKYSRYTTEDVLKKDGWNDYASAGLKASYQVRSDDYLLDNWVLSVGSEWAFYGNMISPDYKNVAPALFHFNGDEHKMWYSYPKWFNKAGDKVPEERFKRRGWTEPPSWAENKFFRNVALSTGASNAYYLYYDDENNYCVGNLNAGLSTKKGFEAGTGIRMAITPYSLISFDFNAELDLYHANVGGEMELGPRALYGVVGASLELGPYLGIGTHYGDAVYLVHWTFSNVFQWSGQEYEAKFGTRGVSFGATENAPGERGGRIVVQWFPIPMVSIVNSFNPGKITKFTDGSRGTYETARCLQIINTDGSTISYIQQVSDTNTYTIHIDPAPEEMSLGEQIASLIGNTALDMTLVGGVAKYVVVENSHNKGERKVSVVQDGNEKHYMITDTFEDGRTEQYLFKSKGNDDYELIEIRASKDGKNFTSERNVSPGRFNKAEWTGIKRQLAPLRDMEKVPDLEKVIDDPAAPNSKKASAMIELAHIYARCGKHLKHREYIEKAYELLRTEIASVKTLNAESLKVIKEYSQACFELGELKLNDPKLLEKKQEGYTLIAESRRILETHISATTNDRYQALLKIEYAKRLLALEPYQEQSDDKKKEQRDYAFALLQSVLPALENKDLTPPLGTEERQAVSDAYYILGERIKFELKNGSSADPENDFQTMCKYYQRSFEYNPEANALHIANLYTELTALGKEFSGIYQKELLPLEQLQKLEQDFTALIDRCDSSKNTKEQAIRAIKTRNADIYFMTALEIKKKMEEYEKNQNAPAEVLAELKREYEGLLTAAQKQYLKLFKEFDDLEAGMQLVYIYTAYYGADHEATLKAIHSLISALSSDKFKGKHFKVDLYLSQLYERLYAVPGANTPEKERKEYLDKAVTCMKTYLRGFPVRSTEEYTRMFKLADLQFKQGNIDDALDTIETIAKHDTKVTTQAKRYLAMIHKNGILLKSRLLEKVPSLNDPKKLAMLFLGGDGEALIPLISLPDLEMFVSQGILTKEEAAALEPFLKAPEKSGGRAKDLGQAEEDLVEAYDQTLKQKVPDPDEQIDILIQRALVREECPYYIESNRKPEIERDINSALTIIDSLITHYSEKGDTRSVQMLEQKKKWVESYFKIDKSYRTLSTSNDLETLAESNIDEVAIPASIALADQSASTDLDRAESYYTKAYERMNALPEPIPDLDRREKMISLLLKRAAIKERNSYIFSDPEEEALKDYTTAYEKLNTLIQKYKDKMKKDPQNQVIYMNKIAELQEQLVQVEKKINALKAKIEKD